jgi:RNAse (barnase) inhibitor barstar
MAPFTLGYHDKGPSTLDWRLLSQSAVSLYMREEFLEEDSRELLGLGYAVVGFDCSGWTSWDTLYNELEVAFEFRKWGRNLNAFRDVLRDIDVPDAGGMVVLLRAIDSQLERVEPIIEVLADTSRYWLLFGRRFLLLAQTGDPQYRAPADLGAAPAYWNPREWLNSARGLG